MRRRERILRLIHDMSVRLEDDHSLQALARRASNSKFELHRAFRKLIRETPKQFVQRLRLERAGVALSTGNEPVLEIALSAAFGSHEVFARAFRRLFGCSPTQYRRAALRGASDRQRARHREIVRSVGPCIHLFHIRLKSKKETPAMSIPKIARIELKEQSILFIRRSMPFTQLQANMGECFGTLYGHGQKAGLAIAGQPIARYVSTGPGLWTVDFAMPLFSPAPGDADMQAGFLPKGPAAFAVHMGPYDLLAETNAAIQRWIEAEGFSTNGAPWESYVTDPGQTPDPADWRTEVYWPLAE
jgi:AraC family transcriptional regulator